MPTLSEVLDAPLLIEHERKWDELDDEVPTNVIVDLELFWRKELEQAATAHRRLHKKALTLSVEMTLLENLIKGAVLNRGMPMAEDLKDVLRNHLTLVQIDNQFYKDYNSDRWWEELKRTLVKKYVDAEKLDPSIGWCQTHLMVKIKARDCLKELKRRLKDEFREDDDLYLHHAVQTAFTQ